MVTDNDLYTLLNKWNERMHHAVPEQPYKDALYDCMYDLKSLLKESFEEELIKDFSTVQEN